MKEEKIKCLLVEPYKLPKEIEIDNTLEAKQKIVDGLIECVYFNDVIIICMKKVKLMV